MDTSKLNRVLEWVIYILGYTFILMIVSLIFKNTIHIDYRYYGLYALLTTLIIYIINKTIKPFIVQLTLPITALTLGIFYPFINVLILKAVDLIMFDHFDINGIFMSFLVAILISLMNIILDKAIINPLLGKD